MGTPGAEGPPISFALLGVGVGGGGVLALCPRRLLDTGGSSAEGSLATPFGSASVPVFLLRPLCTGTGDGAGAVADEDEDEEASSEAAINRADLRVDIFATSWDLKAWLTAE